MRSAVAAYRERIRLLTSSMFAVAAAAALVSACAPRLGPYGAGASGVIPPCDSGASANVAGFAVTVQDVKWSEQVASPTSQMLRHSMMPNLPPQTQAYMQAPLQKAQNDYLVVDLRITNMSQEPLGWSTVSRQMEYRLVDQSGAKYQAEQNLSGMTWAGSMRSFNPGASASGSVVFDVPKQDYTFMIHGLTTTSANLAGRTYGRSAPYFTCRIVRPSA